MNLNRTTSNRLEAWLRQSVVARPTDGQPLDIHIDQLVEDLDPSCWVERGLRLFAAANCSPSLDGTACVVCLVFHLDPDVDLADIDVASPQTQWAGYLDLVPPELVLIRRSDEYAAKYERALRETGRLIGALDVVTGVANVYLTERVDRYDDQLDRVRHLWVVPKREQ